MNRSDADRLWTHVQSLLRHPGAPDDYELRRAARMLASSRSDAVELLLAQWLAQGSPREDLPAPEAAAPGLGTSASVAHDAAGAAVPARAAPRFGLREAALVTAGVAGGVVLGSLLGDDEGVDLDLG